MEKKEKMNFIEIKKSSWKKNYSIILASTIIIFLYTDCFADRIAYNKIVDISVESDEIIVNHHHDWSNCTDKNRSKMMASDQNPFSDENNYAYIECIDKKTGNKIFKSPCSALTYIYICKNSHYIIGLSKIKLDNPFQLVIFDRNGNLIKKRHISPREAALTLLEYNEFKKKFQAVDFYLILKDRIIIDSDKVYIDFSNMGSSIESNDAREYLRKKESESHLSRNLSESIMNWIYWYCEENPDLQLKYEDKELLAVSLLDPKGKRFEVLVYEAIPER